MSEASEHGAIKRPPCRGVWRHLGVALAALALLFGAAIPASAAELMRVTFVRHGESAGNASGLIDTSTPGPVLTATGQRQAEAVVGKLGVNNYDAVYASTMVRTQLTAAPMSNYLRLPTHVLPGLQEIEAGVFEGTPESQAANGYARFPLGWVFQGNRELRIPGSIDGNEFDARVDGALKTIYDNGDRNSVVFSHGGAIMFWNLMNAKNLTMEQKLDLLRNHPLGNTDFVVIEGNPEDGWTVVNWNGTEFGTDTTLNAEVQLQVQTLSRQLAAASKQLIEAFTTLNPVKIVAAIAQGVVDATYSLVKFAGAVNDKFVKEVAKANEAAVTPAVTNTSTLAAITPVPTPATSTSTVSARSANKTVVDEPAPAVESTITEVKAVEAPNGATDLSDGNKAVPGTTSAEKADDTAGKTDTVEPATTSAPSTTAETGAADAESAGSDAADAA